MNIKEAAQIALGAYGQGPNPLRGYQLLNTIISSYGLTSNETIPIQPIGFEIEDISGNQILVFRGTDNWKNWITDFDIKEDEGVHKGFFELFEHIQNQIRNKPNIIIGHSLGGALALLASKEFDCACYTFACPNIGTKEYCNTFNNYIMNTENVYDVITHVPANMFKPGSINGLDEWDIDPIKLHSMQNYLNLVSK